MNFANPIWLYGLLGIAIPILIHLWSKKEGKTIKVGSIKFYPESETRQSRRLNPSEFLLLFIRSLLIAFLVLLIAQPILIGKKKKERPTVLIESSLLGEDRMGSILDTLLTGDYSVRLLEEGLPEFDPESLDAQKGVGSYWNMISEIEELASNEIIIFASNQASAFKGRLPTISKKLKWYAIPPKAPVQKILSASFVNDNYYLVRATFREEATEVERLNFTDLSQLEGIQSKSNAGEVQFKTLEQEDWVSSKRPGSTKVSIVYGPGFSLDAQLWQAAFQAIEETNGIPMDISVTSVDTNPVGDNDILVWLSDALPMASQAERTLVYRADPLNTSLIEDTIEPKVNQITRRLSLANITAEDVSEELLNALWTDVEQLDALAANDQRLIPTTIIEPTNFGNGQTAGKEIQAVPYMYWVAFMVLLALERAVSFKRKQ